MLLKSCRILGALCNRINRHSSLRMTSRLSLHTGALASLLQPHHLDIVKEERKMLKQLFRLLESMESKQEDLDLVQDTMSRVDEVFMVVVVGEFNAGKSTFVNSLLGGKFLKDGILPTTDKICILRNLKTGSTTDDRIWTKAKNLLLDDVEEMDLPVDWLQHIALIDTPGTNAIIERHEQLTQRIVPRADLVLFVTSAERPISESEANFLIKIKQWGKKIIMVVNKIDILQPDEKIQVLEYVSQNVAKLIGGVHTVPVFGVSSRQALSAKLVVAPMDPALGPGAGAWEESRLGILEKHLQNLLGQDELILGKLENVVGVADRMTADVLTKLEERKHLLESDVKILELIDDTMNLFTNDLQRDIQNYNITMSKLFDDLDKRCDIFLNERVSLFRPDLIFDIKKFQNEFNKEVLLDMSSPVDSALNDVSAMVVQRGRTQARVVLEYVGNRPKRFSAINTSSSLSSSLLGVTGNSGGGVGVNVLRDDTFDAVRYEMLDRLRREVGDVLSRMDKAEEAERVRGEISTGLMQTAGIQGVSVAAVGMLFTAQMLDVTGVLVASGVMTAGLFVLPFRRYAVKKEFSRRVEILRSQMSTTMASNLTNQINNLKERIMESIGPYSRFIRLENQKLEDMSVSATTLREVIRDIRNKLRK
eukprot:gene4479-8914_t